MSKLGSPVFLLLSAVALTAVAATTCTVDSDCASDKRCWFYLIGNFNLCTDPISQSNCDVDADCPSSYSCLTYPDTVQGQPHRQCTGSPTFSQCRLAGKVCPAGEYCSMGHCFTPASLPSKFISYH